MDLFSSEMSRESQIILLKDAHVTYTPYFYNAVKAKEMYNTLFSEIIWQQDEITLFGKTHLQPRLTALYGDDETPYSYSGLVMKPRKFSRTLQLLKDHIEAFTGEHFNAVLCNLYRDGKDSNGWHSDDEKELGIDPFIASLSFGETRTFRLKHKQDIESSIKLTLGSGSLLCMGGMTQHYYKHQLSKTTRQVQSRINLTFRRLYKSV